jgi:hypothetical protein
MSPALVNTDMEAAVGKTVKPGKKESLRGFVGVMQPVTQSA